VDTTDLITIARTLAVDTVTAEVVTALHAAGLEPILIKGPTISQWLYADEAPRAYQDSDLLVDPAQQEQAAEVLAGLGFVRQRYAWEGVSERLFHAGAWHRPADHGTIDLHLTLPGTAGASPQEVWTAVSRRTVPWGLPGGITVRAPDLATRTMLVGLHAVHHIRDGGAKRPLADLALAVERVELPIWLDAAALAVDLRSGADLARALNVTPDGRDLARRIGLTVAATGHEDTIGIERILATRGIRERGRALRRALLPARSYLRYSSPLARRGRLGLTLAYAGRPFSLAAAIVRGYWRLRRDGVDR
jgi:hypothetical protein